VNKAQINMVTGLGMMLMVVWALINLWSYTQDMGMATNMRNDLNNAILNSEKARSLLSQERTYALDRALLIAGTTSDGGCGFMEAANTFPYIPTLNTSTSRNVIYYWKKDGSTCVPTWEDIGNDVETYLKDVFGFVNLDRYGIENTRIVSEEYYPMTLSGGKWTGQFTQEYLQDTYTIELQEDGSIAVYDSRGRIVTHSMVGEHIVLEDRKFFMKGPLPYDIVLSVYYGENGKTYKCQEIDGVKYLFEAIYNDAKGEYEYFATPANTECNKIPGAKPISLTVGSIVTLKYENDCEVQMGDGGYSQGSKCCVSSYKCPSDNQVASIDICCEKGYAPTCVLGTGGKSVGTITCENDILKEYKGNVFYVPTWVIEKNGKTIDEVIQELSTNPTSASNTYQGLLNFFSLLGMLYDTTSNSGFYDVYCEKDCGGESCYAGTCMNEEFSRQRQYRVAILDNASGGFISLEEYSPMNFVISKDMMYYVPENKQWVKVDKEIGQISLDKGQVVYDFIPSSRDKLCYDVTGTTYNITNCLSLYTRTAYFGEFPDLYSYAESFVRGDFEGYKGWMEYNIADLLKNKNDVVDMKSLKIIDGTNVLAKNDWKTSLINHFGLIGTDYTWDFFNDSYCQFEFFYVGETIPTPCPIGYYDVGSSKCCPTGTYYMNSHCEKPILRCNCSYGDPLACQQMMNQSIIAEFLRMIEGSNYILESQTGYPWSIRVKDMQISVEELCTHESFQTEYVYETAYDNSSNEQVVGIPMQFLFAEESGVSVSGDSNWCTARSSTGNIDEPCRISATVTSVCQQDVVIGTETYDLSCTLKGYCCPAGYDDYLEIGGVRHPCCRLESINQVCRRGVGLGSRSYKCIAATGEYDLTETYTCPFYEEEQP
jgi:hypothetical protein